MKRHLGVVGVAYFLGVGTILLLVANTDSETGKPAEIATLSATSQCCPVQQTKTCESGYSLFSTDIVDCGSATCTGYCTLTSDVIANGIINGRPIYDSVVAGIVLPDFPSDKTEFEFDFTIQQVPIPADTFGGANSIGTNTILSTNQTAFVITSDNTNCATRIVNFSNSLIGTTSACWHSETAEGTPVTAKVFPDGTMGHMNVFLNWSENVSGNVASTNTLTIPAGSGDLYIPFQVAAPSVITLCGANVNFIGLMPATIHEAPKNADDWNVLSWIGIESGTGPVTDSPGFHSQPLDHGNLGLSTWGPLMTKAIENLGFNRRALSPVPTPDDDVVILGNPTAIIVEEAPTAGDAPEKSGVDGSNSAGQDDKE